MERKNIAHPHECPVFSGSCRWSPNDNFCDVLRRAGVPHNGKWPPLVVHLRSLADDIHLSEVQKAAMQELLIATLQQRDFSQAAYARIADEIQKIQRAPFDQKLQEIMREAESLAHEVNNILGRHRNDVITAAQSVDNDIAGGVEPARILSGLRDALRGMLAKMEEDTQALSALSHHDALTGLTNRRFFDAFLDETVHLWQEKNVPAALLMLDIDNFKRFNDRFGHLVGDQVLITVAGRIDRQVQSLVQKGTEAIAARYGGEEFAVILRGEAAAGATEFAEHMRAVIADTTLLLRDANDQVISQGIRLTVSAGVAALWKGWRGAFQTNLIDCADKALYHGKRAGKNCVFLYTPEGKAAYTRVTPKA